jgi:uncharacterized protein
MATSIFVNLPTRDLDKAKAFHTSLGFTINPQFTDEKAACIVISDTIYAMILKEEFFKTFISNKQITEASNTTEVIVALSADSKQKVDEMADKALAAGGKKLREPEDHGFMYSRSFQDPDGHIWEVLWMDPAAIKGQQ